ncbi:MAG: saccharopine dehydrogenase NADP-binding domain-containing protein, partial [Salinisphaera sp.]|nr:saccharopine dehydrogenase NADP-binding domain-containing protein [Salinisphaera sp.]
MKILALGGAGAVGRATLAHVCGFAEVESVTIADIDAKGAAAAASVLGDKAQPLTLDILDARAMDRALAPADLVLNTSGPYFRFGLPAFHAALEAGRAYFDVCDDPEPTLGMLTADHRARKAG